MADPNSQQSRPQPRRRRSKSTSSSRCCEKKFKPKTDEAKEAVERAVRTLAEQALADTQLISTRCRQVDRGDHRRSSTRS